MNKTVISSLLFIMFLSQKYLGFLFLFFIIPFFVWFLHSFYVLIFKENLRYQQLMKIFIWVFSIVFVFSFHYYEHVKTRKNADHVVAVIKKYKSIHGDWPKSIDAAGITKEEFKRQVGLGFYEYNENRSPFFLYAATYIPMEKFGYNFERNIWQINYLSISSY